MTDDSGDTSADGEASTPPGDGISDLQSSPRPRCPTDLPPDLPEPVDDGAADYLDGATVPHCELPATDTRTIDLGERGGRVVLACVPLLAHAEAVSIPEGWASVPGARGCAAEVGGFRDEYRALRRLGVDEIVGLSAQPADVQRVTRDRLGVPFEFLADPEFRLAEALDLPTNAVAGRRYYQRLTLLLEEGRISRVWYPVFPPDDHACEVRDYLAIQRE